MKAPSFWNSKTIVSALLLPLSWCYLLASTLQRRMVKPVKLPIPVICVGNVTAGGAGKTPVALYIGGRLKEKNIRAFYLTRGYGGTLPGPVLVDLDKHTAREVSDEPMLLARTLPTVVAKDRKEGAAFAIARGAQAIIMDDGFQNPSLEKTLSLVVIDSGIGMGNGRLLPAGPLRESASQGLDRADGIIILSRTAIASHAPSGKPIFFANTKGFSPISLAKKEVIAFCGIAYPKKFVETLSLLGAIILSVRTFSDHHHYTKQEFAALKRDADIKSALLVTTAKDAVRLSKDERAQVTIVEIALEFDRADELDALLDKALVK